MLKKIVLVTFIILSLVSCQKNNIEIMLTNPNSVWRYTSKSLTNPDHTITADLKFKDDGYIYEQGTILNFPWSYDDSSKVLILKNQKFDVISFSKNEINLKNQKSGNSAKLELIK